MHERNQGSNSDILNEECEVTCVDFHERTFQGSFEDQFDSGKVELQFEQPYWDKQMT